MKVTVPTATHRVVDPMLNWMDYNIYPAENAVLLQGATNGPIGDQTSVWFALVGVHDHTVNNGPSHLEAVMIYPVDCDDCPGDATSTARIDSQRSPPSKPAHLLSVTSMHVEDVNQDGRFEVICQARFQPCCTDEAVSQTYTETIVLQVQGTNIVQVADPGQTKQK